MVVLVFGRWFACWEEIVFCCWRRAREQLHPILLSLVARSSREAVLSVLGRLQSFAKSNCGDHGGAHFRWSRSKLDEIAFLRWKRA